MADTLAYLATEYFAPLFSGRPEVAETHGPAILQWLALAEHRDALVAWLVEAVGVEALVGDLLASTGEDGVWAVIAVLVRLDVLKANVIGGTDG